MGLVNTCIRDSITYAASDPYHQICVNENRSCKSVHQLYQKGK